MNRDFLFSRLSRAQIVAAKGLFQDAPLRAKMRRLRKPIPRASIRRRHKPCQASPSPAKQNQTKLLGFAWFYSSESGLINGLRRFQIRVFLLVLALSPGAPSLRDCRDHVGAASDFRKMRVEKIAAYP
jgi:hypothetical protein